MSTVKIPRLLLSLSGIVLCLLSTSNASNYPRLLNYSISEELPISTPVGDVRRDINASSAWSSEEHKLRFHLKNAHKHFTIGERDGMIHTNHVLDREALCPDNADPCEQSFEVVVRAGHQSHVRVIVQILDINDHAPAFPKDNFHLNIPETASSGTTYLIPAAEDLDVGQNGIQNYRLSGSELFQLVENDQGNNKKEVRIKLNGRLDREQQEVHTLHVVAVDGGEPQLSGSLVVTITVLDANDNSPHFEKSSYFVQIPEDTSPSTTLLTVRATDPDSGSNGLVRYSFSDYDEKSYGHIFGINSNTGEIFTKDRLDFEQTQTYALTVQASDAGLGSLPEFTKVIVNLTDVNDNYPEISAFISESAATVQENLPPGVNVAHVLVNDKDSGENKKVSCSIDNAALFKFEKLYDSDSDYMISTGVSFDREEGASHQILITCQDHGSPPLTNYKEIEVDITDVNDNPPVLNPNSNYNISIYENNSPNLLITKINATDADSGRNAVLQYSLHALSPAHQNVLYVDPILGKITSNMIFDYEKESEYKFLVNVTDRGSPSLSATATLVLHILDFNDEEPKFEKPSYYLSVPENNPIDSFVGSVKATDSDASSEFNKIRYRIVSADDAFQINEESGEIRNLKRLDREEQPLYKFQVVASNPGVPVVESRINVTVYVDDVNDNAPSFVFPNTDSGNVIQIATNSNPGTLVTRLVATDADVGPNAELIFSISNGNVDNSFAIDPTTGVITVAKSLKESGAQDRLHRLVISVSDLGNPPLMSVADLNIFINSSLGKEDSTQALTNKISDKNLIILAASVGTVLLLVICIAVIAVRVSRRQRRRRNERGKYMVTKVLDAYETESNQTRHCRSGCTQSNEASSSTVDCRKLGSSSVTVDTTSSKSEAGGCNCRGPGVNAGGPREEEDEDLEMCRLHDPGTMIMTNSWDPAQNIRITPVSSYFQIVIIDADCHRVDNFTWQLTAFQSLKLSMNFQSNMPGAGDPHAGRCSSATCRGFGGSPSYYHRHHYCNCCNSHVACHSPPNQQCHYPNPPHQQAPPFMMRNKRSLYSPESIPVSSAANCLQSSRHFN